MSWRCEAPACEGWQLTAEDRFCPNCGQWLQPLELNLPGRVLCQPVAELKVSYLGRSGQLDLSQLALPDWLRVSSPLGVLGPGDTQNLALEVRQHPREGLPGTIRCLGAEVEVWCSCPPRAELRFSQHLLNPEESLIEGELRLLEGALQIDELPPGWSSDQNLPVILSLRARPLLKLRAPAVAGPVRWQIGELLLESEISCHWAGTLHVPRRLPWCLTRHRQLRVPLEVHQGPVELERVDCAVATVSFPPRLEEGAGELWLTAGPDLAEGEASLELYLSDGRRRTLWLDLHKPERRPYPGWLLLDFGSTASTAALIDEEGRLTLLPLGGETPYLPSGLAYFEDGRREITDQPGDHVILEAKRNLGRADFSFRLALPESGRVLERTPVEAVSDYFEAWLRAIQPHMGLYTPRRCCLAHPAAFSPRQVGELRQALQRHLEGPLEMLSEPLAAAYYYLSQKRLPARQWRLLLYDFGGTTSDVAVLRVDSRVNTMVTAELEHVGGDRWFGGADITALLASLLPPEQAGQAEALKCSAPPRQSLDGLVESRLKLSLPDPPLWPDLIVLSGRGSLYPLVGEWLQRQFVGVPLERCPQPKDCVVLGARLHPEVLRSLGPRSLAADSTWLHFPDGPGPVVCTTRLGLKVLGGEGARWHSMVALGQPLPCRAELAPLALLAGSNPLEIVENLGTDSAFVLPDGTANSQLVTLERLVLRLERTPDPARTRLGWELSADYRLRLTVWLEQELLYEVGPMPLWPG